MSCDTELSCLTLITLRLNASILNDNNGGSRVS